MNVSLPHVALFLFGVLLSSVSQAMLKAATRKTYDVWWKEYLNPMVIFAYVIYVLVTLLTIFAYRGVPLSMTSLLNATGYFYVLFFGAKFFREKITAKKIGALAVIVFGIVVYAFFDRVIGMMVLF